MQIVNKIVLGLVSLLVIGTSLANVVVAKESKAEYVKDGMTFIVGKHEPEKRVNQKEKATAETKQVIIHKHETVIVPEENDSIEEEKENKNDAYIEEEDEIKQRDVFAVWSEKMWSVTRDVAFNMASIFEGAVDFLGRVTFMDRVVFADEDMAGNATMIEGQSSIYIEFNKPFVFPPVVTVTPESFFGNFAVKDITEEGFSIVVREDVPEDVEFKWITIATVGDENAKKENITDREENDEIEGMNEDG